MHVSHDTPVNIHVQLAEATALVCRPLMSIGRLNFAVVSVKGVECNTTVVVRRLMNHVLYEAPSWALWLAVDRKAAKSSKTK
jgi:hypothetical protein